MQKFTLLILFSFLLPGSYRCQAYDNDSLYSHTVSENSDFTSIGVIYPNPAGGKINLKFQLVQSQNISMNIEDGKGSVLLHAYFFNVQDGDTKILDLRSLESGIYLLRLYAQNFVFTKKLVKIPD